MTQAMQTFPIDSGACKRAAEEHTTLPGKAGTWCKRDNPKLLGVFTMTNIADARRAAKATFLAGAMFAALAGVTAGGAAAGSLYEEVAADKRLTLFAGAMEQAGMADMLKQGGRYILFVPSDQAMANEGSAFLLRGVLLTPANAGRLKDLVSYHIVPADGLKPDEIRDEDLATMRGVPVQVTRYGKARMVNGWAAVTERREADNGVLYIVDRLLIPSSPDLN